MYDPNPYWQPPGLIYALCVVFRFAGRGLLAPRVVQALLSTACALLAFALARRWFSMRVALATAAVVAFHGVLVFESAELLPSTWIAFFDLVLLLALVRAAETARTAWAIGAGTALGISALMAPAILPFGLFEALWLFVRAGRRFALPLAFCAGAVLVIAPVTLRNYRYGGEWVLISSNGGINLYIGNNEHYAATVAIRPGKHWEALWTEPDRYGIFRRGAASSYFTSKALAFVRAHPLRETGLLLRKFYLFANGAEIPRDTDIYAARAGSPVLRTLVWPGPLHVPDGILIPLALVGIALSWRRRRELWAPLAFVITSALVTAAFFVTSRHRLPVLPVLAMFAVFGAAEIAISIRRPRGAIAAAATVALIALVNLPTREASQSYTAELDFYRGLAFLRESHDPAQAVHFFQQATARDATDERFWFELGNALDAMGRGAEAVGAWSQSAALDPTDPRPRRRIASWRALHGDLDGALAALESNLRFVGSEDRARDHLEVGLLYVRKASYGPALAAFRACAQADPRFWKQQGSGIARRLLEDRAITDADFRGLLGELLLHSGALDPASASPTPPAQP